MSHHVYARELRELVFVSLVRRPLGLGSLFFIECERKHDTGGSQVSRTRGRARGVHVRACVWQILEGLSCTGSRTTKHAGTTFETRLRTSREFGPLILLLSFWL